MSIKIYGSSSKHLEIESPEAGDDHHYDESGEEIKASNKSFWGTVLKIEFADIAFAIDSMLAALAIAVTLPKVGIHFGGYGLRSVRSHVPRWNDWCYSNALCSNMVRRAIKQISRT